MKVIAHVGSICMIALSTSGLAADLAQAAELVGVPDIVQFDTDRWHLGDNARIVEVGGRTALTGTAYLKDVEFLNGTVEVDLWITGKVDFAGFMFRVQSFDEYEWVWLRTHKANGVISDGLQYAPAFGGVACWQLNGGPGGIAPVSVPKNEWVHMKLEVVNDAARLYVEDMTKPVLVMGPLQRGLEKGSVGLQAYLGEAAYFSNFAYSADETSEATASSRSRVPPRNVLTKWKLSPSYQVTSLGAISTYPAQRVAQTNDWLAPAVHASGLVNITRYHGRTGGLRAPREAPDCAILRTYIDSEHAKQVKMTFGYSDAATIFLNQIPLFWGNSAFLARNSADGEWISFHDAVFLNLKEGRNELLVVVAEDFGGWGFQAKLDDIHGIEIRSESEED